MIIYQGLYIHFDTLEISVLVANAVQSAMDLCERIYIYICDMSNKH